MTSFVPTAQWDLGTFRLQLIMDWMTFHIINIKIAQQCIQLKGRGHLFRVNETSKPTPAQRCQAVSREKRHAAVWPDSEAWDLPPPCMLLGAMVGAIMGLWSCSLAKQVHVAGHSTRPASAFCAFSIIVCPLLTTTLVARPQLTDLLLPGSHKSLFPPQATSS